VYHFVRLGLKGLSAAYVRVRIEGAERLPATGGYLVCFNHPSWLDPIVIAAWWPDQERLLHIFGPREADMSVGIRNHLITWTGRGVPFQPGGQDALDATRRSLGVLRGGGVLALAGEGRLSDLEGTPLPFEPGVGHFAILARVPIVPLSIDGTRWVHFGSTIRLRIGEPIDPTSFGSGRAAAAAVSEAAHSAVTAGLAGVTERPKPGPFGAWFSELFNDRPWLDEPADPDASDPGAAAAEESPPP
jgi:1-acyl-sn-glycerol-3-phosphate acyltransferase